MPKHHVSLLAGLSFAAAACSVSAQPLEIIQTLRPLTDRNAGSFGADIDAEHETLVVGDAWAPSPSSPGYMPDDIRGRVYIYARGGAIERTQILTRAASNEYDRFGDEVELGNGRLVVASRDARGSTIHTATRTDGVWAIDQTLTITTEAGAFPQLLLRGDALLLADTNRPSRIYDWSSGGWTEAELPDALSSGAFEVTAFDGATIWSRSLDNNPRWGTALMRVFDRQPDATWTERTPLVRSEAFPYLPAYLVADGAVYAPRSNDGVYTYGLDLITQTDTAWERGTLVEAPYGHDTRLGITDPVVPTPLPAAVDGDRIYVLAEAWPDHRQPESSGVAFFAIDPDRGLMPRTYLTLPGGTLAYTDTIHTDGPDVFVTKRELTEIAPDPKDPGEPRAFWQGVVHVAAADQFDAACPADFALPVGTLDLADITQFVRYFGGQVGVRADPAPPHGVYDTADIAAFVDAFLNGCD